MAKAGQTDHSSSIYDQKLQENDIFGQNRFVFGQPDPKIAFTDHPVCKAAVLPGDQKRITWRLFDHSLDHGQLKEARAGASSIIVQ